MNTPEPWLRGPLPGGFPLIMPVLHSFQQVREDIDRYVGGLSSNDIWCNVQGASIGFHLKHMAGSVERLTAYLMGRQLTPEQVAAAREENDGDETADLLIASVERALADCERQLRTIAPESLYDARFVGRKRLPSSVLGLLVHLAEHTQRHLGQAITLAKLMRQTPEEGTDLSSM